MGRTRRRNIVGARTTVSHPTHYLMSQPSNAPRVRLHTHLICLHNLAVAYPIASHSNEVIEAVAEDLLVTRFPSIRHTQLIIPHYPEDSTMALRVENPTENNNSSLRNKKTSSVNGYLI
jgi:hypothetical protein